MITVNKKTSSVSITLPVGWGKRITSWYERVETPLVFLVLFGIAIWYFRLFLLNGLALSYNDARSHLDIGRRVVEGLKPGLAQLGSVWLPLNHVLMIPTIWNDWMWHTGLSGALQNMMSFALTGSTIVLFLKRLRVGVLGRILGVFLFVANLNILYLQSTAMTELLLLATMTLGCYYLLVWHETDNLLDLIKSAFWIMLATLVRYDGWFLLTFAGLLAAIQTFRRHGLRRVEGVLILFFTLSAFGVLLWLLWNQLIFKDALYFMLGPFSAHAQQQVMEKAGALPTKHNLLLSLRVYSYAAFYNTYTIPAILALVGFGAFLFDRSKSLSTKLGVTAIWSPVLFNILALYFGFSVLYIQGISGNTWFNVRYGIMVMPAIAICVAYLFDKAKQFRLLLVGILLFVLFFAFMNQDAVTIDDARVGSSQKNVSQVSDYLHSHAQDTPGFILISAASHDAIIFSSGLPMKRFIHEGTGEYWKDALHGPEHWARWIVMRSYDENDLVWRSVSRTSGFHSYTKVASYPFADVYELQATESGLLHLSPVPGKNEE